MCDTRVQLPSDWTWQPLKELADVVSGGTPARENPAFWNGDVPWVTPTDITGTKGVYLTFTAEKITIKGLRSSSANLLPKGTVLMTSRATVGEAKLATTAVATNQGFKSLVPHINVDGLYLLYQMQFLKAKYSNFGTGTTFLEVNKKDTERFKVPVPPTIAEQRGIAEVLSALDEEIEATEALIRKKTAVKRALAMTLMPKPHGLVGANWRETSFGALVVSVREKFLPTEQERTVPCVNLEDVPEGEGRISGFTSAADNLSTKTAFKKGDILFGKLRPYLRKFAITPFDGVCTTEILVFRAVKDVDPDFVFQLVASDAFIEHNVASSYGTKMPRTDWRTAASFPVALPSLAEQRVIGQTLSAADAELAGLRTEAAKLRLQKQGLMKDLLTGAVRV